MASDRASEGYVGEMGWIPDLRSELHYADVYAAESPVQYRPRQVSEIQDAYLVALHNQHMDVFGERIQKGTFACHVLDIGAGIRVQKTREQMTGSCVASGHARALAWRSLIQIMIFGQFQKLMGRELAGPDSLLSFAPYSYGLGRYIGGIHLSGPGSFCAPHGKGLQQGILDCNTPGLPSPLPEPDKATYDRWGRNIYHDQFKSAATVKLLENFRLTDPDDLLKHLGTSYIPFAICSNWGFAPSGQTIDLGNGSKLHLYRRSGTWAHNMTLEGIIILPEGAFVIVANTWPETSHKPVPGLPWDDYSNCFVIDFESVFKPWLRDAVCMAVGEIDLEDYLLAA